MSIYYWFGTSAMEDPEFIDILATQVSEIVDNGEYDLLDALLRAMENQDAHISQIRDIITDSFGSVADLETALEIKEELKSLDYYNANVTLDRDSTIVASHIQANGTREISTTPGTGFYKDETDSSSSERVGLPTSPLYDAKSITYLGDFKIKREYGVRLNSYYEETSYSRTSYYFRDNHIDFSPNDGECVYSGDYLFCFGSDGSLIGFDKIKEK